MDNEPIIRKATAEDIEPLIELYKEVWPDVPFDFRQKVNFILKESQGISYLAEMDGKIVGSRTSFFMPMMYQGRNVKCAHIGDSCVSDSFRRRGLFSKMNRTFLDDFFGNAGGELVYNISVDISRLAYEKLGWQYIKSLQCLRHYFHPIQTLLKVGFDVRKLHGNYTIDSRNIVLDIDPTLLSAREMIMEKKLHVSYTEESFRWRIKSGNGIKMILIPSVGVVICKTCVKESGVSFVDIGEIFLYNYDHQNFRLAIKFIDSQLKPDYIRAYVSIGHPLYPHYIKCGITPILGKSFTNHGVKAVDPICKEVFTKPRNWAISYFDIDTF